MRSTFVMLFVLLSSFAAITGAAQRSPAENPQTSDWRRVEQLQFALRLFVETDRRQREPAIFLHADAERLILLDPRRAPKEAVRLALESARTDGAAFGDVLTSRRYVQGTRQIGPDGILIDGRKLGEIYDLVRVETRGDVVRVALPAETGKNVFRAIGVGLLAAAGIVNVMSCRCSEPTPTFPGFVLTIAGVATAIQGDRMPDSAGQPLYERPLPAGR